MACIRISDDLPALHRQAAALHKRLAIIAKRVPTTDRLREDILEYRNVYAELLRIHAVINATALMVT